MAAKKSAAKKSPKKSAKKTSSKRNDAKTLESLIKQCLTDEDFVKALEKSPKATLEEHGYAAEPKLVKEIQKIDFAVFRKFAKRANAYFC